MESSGIPKKSPVLFKPETHLSKLGHEENHFVKYFHRRALRVWWSADGSRGARANTFPRCSRFSRENAKVKGVFGVEKNHERVIVSFLMFLITSIPLGQ